MAIITINGNSFDPIEEPTPSPPSDLSQSNYILIQTNPSLTDERRAELAGLGVTILEYLPRYSYLCRYEKANLQAIRNLEYISWVGNYSSDLKSASDLFSANGAEPKEVDVVFHDDVDPKKFREAIAAQANLNPDSLKLGRHKVRLTIQPTHLSAVAAIDDVRHIEEVRPAEFLDTVARVILGVVAADGNSSVPFEGEGQIVVVADSGFDIGSKDNVHRAFVDGQNGASRVLQLYAVGRPQSGETNDPTGHGTHVAGLVLGDGESQRFGKVRGTAPKARLIVQSLLDENNKVNEPVDLHDLFLKPYTEFGARIHNNSWGRSPGNGVYTPGSSEVDDFVWNHRDFVVCFAAGNEGRDSTASGKVDSKSITAPGTAKNCITVGATESVRPEIDHPERNLPEFALTYSQKFGPGLFPADPFRDRRVAADSESVAAISSRGPAGDNRIKPDVVAPGTFILSARSRQLDPDVSLWAETAELPFIFHGGTSMASPLVAGCAALVREFLAEVHHITNPSAALVKSLLINGARPLGQNGNAASVTPDFDQGFGRVDMPATVGPFPPNVSVTPHDEATALVQGQLEVRHITIEPQMSLLKVTLVWTDPPGDGLQNDLDLIVKSAGGEKRHGNKQPGETDFDRVNNVEQVVWNNFPAGDVEITVTAARIENFRTTALCVGHSHCLRVNSDSRTASILDPFKHKGENLCPSKCDASVPPGKPWPGCADILTRTAHALS